MSLKIKNILIIISIALLLTTCFGDNDGSMANSAEYNPNLGKLVSNNPTPTNTYQVPDLQQFLLGTTNGICTGMQNSTNPECLHIESLINNDKSRFGLINTDVTNMVTKNATDLGITAVKSYQLVYTTSGAPIAFAGSTRQTQNVSGLVLVPKFAKLADESKIKGVVLYYHPTVFNKLGVPSFSNPEGMASQQMLAAIYASQGYIVVAPDYIGQGVNAGVIHPYVVYAQANAKSGLYMLKAYKEFIQKNYPNIDSSKLFITSYSEGAPYALWASKLLQSSYAKVLTDTGLDLKRTVGISGAYDLSGVTIRFEFANTDNSKDPSKNPYYTVPSFYESNDAFANMGVYEAVSKLQMAVGKLSLFNYVIVAYMNYNANTSGYQILMNQDFINMKSCGDIVAYIGGAPTKQVGPCLIESQHYTLNQLFTSPKLSTTDIQMTMFASAYGAANYFSGNYTFESLLYAMSNGYANNSVGSVVNPSMLDEPLVMDYVAQQDIYNWTTTSPISLIALGHDSIVTNLNTKEACDKDHPSLASNSASGLVKCGGDLYLNNYTGGYLTSFSFNSISVPLYVDHGTAEPILQLMALHQIEMTN